MCLALLVVSYQTGKVTLRLLMRCIPRLPIIGKPYLISRQRALISMAFGADSMTFGAFGALLSCISEYCRPIRNLSSRPSRCVNALLRPLTLFLTCHLCFRCPWRSHTPTFQRAPVNFFATRSAPVCRAVERHVAASCRLGCVWTSDVDVFALGIKSKHGIGASFLSDGALFVSFSPATSFGRVFERSLDPHYAAVKVG